VDAKSVSPHEASGERACRTGRSCTGTRCIERWLRSDGTRWQRGSRAPNADDHVILPEVISKEPLGPLVRHGDDRWFDIVKWSLFAMIEAEELGLSSRNIAEQAQSGGPAIQRFVGANGDLGKLMGLDNRWAFQIVKQVGNYGESFDANLKPLGFERGLNRLWTQGGLLYAPPLR